MDGNQAVALGAIQAGCNFFAGYPITPATGIFNHMLAWLPPRGGICLQGEDEIASLGYCLGASMAGAKALTATSGPGINLYAEQTAFAIAGEIPVVIVDVQRQGPSTGSATLGADGDIQALRWGSGSGLPVIVLAPSDIMDCYLLTAHAFNLAERHRCPVFIASHKEIGATKQSVDLDALVMPEPVSRQAPPEGKPYLPFAVSEGECVPGFMPIGGRTPSRQTSSTHGPDGYITIDSQTIAQTTARLKAKLESKVGGFTYYDEEAAPGAQTVIVTYGVSAAAARQAVRELCAGGGKVSLLVLKTLWPVPEKLIRQKLAKARRVLVVEMNLGQYVREIERLCPEQKVDFLGRMNGTLITPEEIKNALND